MMEFVLSRAWMVIAGLAVTAVILAAFSGLNGSVEREADLEGASALSEMISELQSKEDSLELRIDLGRIMLDQESTYLVREWGIELVENGYSRVAGTYNQISLIEDGRPVDCLHVGSKDILMIRSSSGEVQVEKASVM
jgi:hypothetical protein